MLKLLKRLVFFVLLIGSLVASTYYLLAQIESKFTEHQQVTMETILATTTLGLKNWKKQVVGEFNMWLNSPVVTDFVDKEFRGNIDQWLSSIASYTSANTIYFSNITGVVVASSSDLTGTYIDNDIRKSLDGLDVGDFKYRLVKSSDANNYSFLFSFPLVNFDYEVIGFSHFELNLKQGFSDILESARFGETGKVLAIGLDTAVLNGNYAEFGLYKPPRYKISGGTVNIVDKNGDDWVQIYQWFDGLGCWILIEGKYSELYAVFGFIRQLIIIFSLIVLCVFSFTFLQFIYFSNKASKTNLIYRSSFFDSSDIRLVLEPSGQVVDWSSTAESVFSIKRKKGMSITTLGSRKIIDNFNKAVSTHRTQLFNSKIKGKIYSGSIKILRKNQTEYILVECKDITRQAEYAKSMKDKEERLRTTMQATNQGYFDLNFETKSEYFDVSLVEMLGYPSNTNVDRGVLDSLVHSDDFNQLVEMNTKIFEVSDDKLLTCEVRMRTKTNEWRYILIKTKAVARDEAGRAKRIVGVHTDVTLRKQAQLQLEKERKSVLLLNEELKKSAKIKDHFIATMSHELRTPLNSIISLSDLLLDDGYGEILSDNQRNHLQVIERSGQHLLEIINDILDISKVTSGKMELHYTEIDFDKTMNATLDMVKSLADKKSVNIEYQNAMNVNAVLVDEKRFKQVIINLLTNAIKFTGENKSVGVNCSNTSSHIKLDIWDEGVGISQGDIDKLFKPFVQLDSEHTRTQEGTGLGLSLVKNMVELHAGTVSVQSEEGKGSTFTIVLPLKVPKEKLVEKNKPVFI